MSDAPPVTVVALHGLGLSRVYFDHVAQQVPNAAFLAIDLPGFGDAPALPAGPDMVGALSDHVVARIADEVDGPWVLLGHSMGGKIASSVASRALRGHDPIFGLCGVMLLAPSPPTPEPMAEERRAAMLAWAADGPIDASDAATFIDQNVGIPSLSAADALQVSRDVQRCSPVAWRQWLSVGSRQDVSAGVGVLDLPALILGGSQDADLGADAQPALHAAVYPRARFVPVHDAGHLLADERAGEVAALLNDFITELRASAPPVPPEWMTLIRSPRTIPAVRRVLAIRALPDDPDYAPQILSGGQLQVLRALADVVVPQPNPRIDLAARVDRQLAGGQGDGWRPDGLSGDVDAYRAGLDRCGGIVDLADADRREFVARLVSGESGAATAEFDDAWLTSWFEDARVDLVRQWLAHPATLARIGFDGFATGSLRTAQRGFIELGAGLRDAWEPAGLGSLR